VIIKKPIIILAIAIVLLLIVGFFTNILPFSMLNLETNTYHGNHGGIYGVGELLDQKGYIVSWNTNEMSQTITVHGRINSQIGSLGEMTKYRYLVYIKKDANSDWDLVSQPGNQDTSKYLNSNNPGEKQISGFKSQEYSCYAWNFNIVGPSLAGGGIRVVLQGWINENFLDFTKGFSWKRLQSDEAYLYSGTGGLYLPRGIDEEGVDRPYSTFEIGQTVKIGVETGVGGSSEKPWRVTLNKPYNGEIEGQNDPYIGGKGAVVKEQVFPNDCDPSNTFFTFVVTESMAELSMSSSSPFTVRIWNSVLPKGTLQVDFIDFIAKAPGDIVFSGDSGQFEVGEFVTVEMSATVNSDTQAEIDYIRCSVVYGEKNNLLPSDWGSNRWIVHTTTLGDADKNGCTLPQSITFKAERSGYITVFAKAIDVQGRAGKSDSYRQMFAYDSGNKPPDETTDTGDGLYGGGHTIGWLPWDPSEGNWRLVDDDGSISTLLKIILSIVIFAMFAVIIYYFPIPGGIYGKMLLMILGIGLIVVIWIFL